MSFRNERECLEFCDRLLELNPALDNDAMDLVDSSERRGGNRRQRQRELRQDPDYLLPSGDLRHAGQETLSYVVRLLNDPSFSDFVDRLESFLTSSSDGSQMLDALAAAPGPNSVAATTAAAAVAAAAPGPSGDAAPGWRDE